MSIETLEKIVDLQKKHIEFLEKQLDESHARYAELKDKIATLEEASKKPAPAPREEDNSIYWKAIAMSVGIGALITLLSYLSVHPEFF